MASMRIVLVVLLLAFAGCSDAWDQITRPDLPVKTSDLSEDDWNRDPRFRVVVDDPGHDVVITATSTDGREIKAEGVSDVTLELPDGTWDVRYSIDGHKWDHLDDVRIDATPPAFQGLVRIADATGSSYELGAGARIDGASSVTITDLGTGLVIGNAIPVPLSGLSDGLHAYLVSARDEAGNTANATVQVRVGTATELPAGKYDFGVVARFSTAAQVWDLHASYLTPAEARAQANNEWLGAGFGIDPSDPAVKAVVASEVRPDMDTVEAARALYEYMADHLEYDDQRLEGEGLMTPRQVLLDSEDAQGRDEDADGLVDDGDGNGVAGGICRDLAATYVSLLRAAGIPARLVSGYVGGSVNGFHAWVEFYAGSVNGQPAWMPVDVSPIDGPYDVGGLLQAFGIRIPDYLALRVIPPSGEVEGWSTALGVAYSVPGGSAPPRIEFAKDVNLVATDRGTLCFNDVTLERIFVGAGQDCPARFGFFVGDYITFAERIVDYGIDIGSAPAGTHITADVAYPTASGGATDYQFYPADQAFTLDVPAGKAHAELA